MLVILGNNNQCIARIFLGVYLNAGHRKDLLIPELYSMEVNFEGYYLTTCINICDNELYHWCSPKVREPLCVFLAELLQENLGENCMFSSTWLMLILSEIKNYDNLGMGG